jgi:hypothetical protein
VELFPSARAVGLQAKYLTYAVKRKPNNTRATRLFSPLVYGQNGIANPPMGGFDHADIINVVRRVIRFLTDNNATVYKAWLREIYRVCTEITEERNKQIANNSWHLKLWASWSFRVPEYTGIELVTWDPAASQWR